jgi:pyruvate formate lyase activating enzyme
MRAPGIAFTYNDPIIWAEYAIDVAREARARGLFTVFVSNGYVSPEARAEIFPHMDAANIDLKAFTEEFYARQTLSHLEPVKETLEWLARETGVWVEVTTLLIPGLNDGDDEVRLLSRFVRERMSADVPLHFSAFHP